MFLKIIFQDEKVLEAMLPWQDELDSISKQVVGQSRAYLQQSECSKGECNLGNFFTDAMVYAVSLDTMLED